MNFKNMLVVMLLLLVPALNLESAVGAAPGGGKIFSRFLNQIDGDKHRGQNNDFLIFKVLRLQDPIRAGGRDFNFELQSVNGMKKIVPGTGFIVNGRFDQVVGYFITDSVNINLSAAAGLQAVNGFFVLRGIDGRVDVKVVDGDLQYEETAKKLLFRYRTTNNLAQNIFNTGGNDLNNLVIVFRRNDNHDLWYYIDFGTKNGHENLLGEQRIELHNEDDEDEGEEY